MERPTAQVLFTRHHLVIYRFLRRMTGDPEAAEDLAQDVFVRVLRCLEAYDSRERDLAWLFRIARRLVLDHRRAASRSIRLVRDDDPPTPAVGPVQLLAVTLDEALRGLPDAEREAILLRETGGLAYEEIAAVSGTTVDAVRNRIYKARKTLRETLSPSLFCPRNTDAQENTP